MSVPMYSDRQDKAPVGDLVRELLSKISELLNTQVTLVKTEIKVESRKMATAAAFGVVALVIGFASVLFLGISLILLFSLAFGLVWGSVITTLLFLATTGICGFLAMKEIQKNSAEIDVDVSR
jgi:uncharacterized membrane protein YqjE